MRGRGAATAVYRHEQVTITADVSGKARCGEEEEKRKRRGRSDHKGAGFVCACGVPGRVSAYSVRVPFPYRVAVCSVTVTDSSSAVQCAPLPTPPPTPPTTAPQNIVVGLARSQIGNPPVFRAPGQPLFTMGRDFIIAL